MPEKLDYQVMATTLMGAVNESVIGFLKVKPDKDPEVVTKVLYAEDQLDATTYGEFIDGSYVSVIYFFHNPRDKASNHCCGMFILYVNTSVINNLVKSFGYKNSRDAGLEVAADATGEYCNNVAGIFKKDLNGLGYPELEISTPVKFKGFSTGLELPKGRKNYYRITTYVWAQTIVMDVILAI